MEKGHIVLGDKSYVLSELSDRDIDDLNAYVKDRILEVAELAIKNRDPKVHQVFLDAAVRQASIASWVSNVGIQHILTPKGLGYLLWVQARKDHPDTSPAHFEKLVIDQNKNTLDAKTMRKVMHKLRDINAGSIVEGGEESTEGKSKQSYQDTGKDTLNRRTRKAKLKKKMKKKGKKHSTVM